MEIIKGCLGLIVLMFILSIIGGICNDCRRHTEQAKEKSIEEAFDSIPKRFDDFGSKIPGLIPIGSTLNSTLLSIDVKRYLARIKSANQEIESRKVSITAELDAAKNAGDTTKVESLKKTQAWLASVTPADYLDSGRVIPEGDYPLSEYLSAKQAAYSTSKKALHEIKVQLLKKDAVEDAKSVDHLISLHDMVIDALKR